MLKRFRRWLAYWLAEASDWISPEAAEVRREERRPTHKDHLVLVVLRFYVDCAREVHVPIGVALSCPATGALWFRAPREGESIPLVDAEAASPYLSLAERKLRMWAQSGLPQPEVGPARGFVASGSAGWWKQASLYFCHRVRLTPPTVLVDSDPERALESAYQSMVRPVACCAREVTL